MGLGAICVLAYALGATVVRVLGFNFSYSLCFTTITSFFCSPKKFICMILTYMNLAYLD
jgi:hypothetical protein